MNIEEETGAASMINVQVHPLVVLNVSDHFTRASVNKADPSAPHRVIGALLGVQTGRTIEIFTSFELVETDSDTGLNLEYLEGKKSHYNAVFPTYELVGWYTSGVSLTPKDQTLHKAFLRYNEFPLLLQMDTQPPPDATSLPVFVYESVISVVNDAPTFSFKRIRYTIESEESERISVDNVAHGTESGSVATPLRLYRDAMVTLRSRVMTVKAYAEGVRSGRHEPCHQLLREVSALCRQMPLELSMRFKESFSHEYSDSLLIAYLSALTRTCFSLKQLVDEHNSVYEKWGAKKTNPFSF